MHECDHNQTDLSQQHVRPCNVNDEEKMARKLGYTLVEVLVVIAVIGVITAIVLPALLASKAKAKAKATDDLSRLRQMGTAGALYHDEHGAWPLRADDLVASGRISKDFCMLASDPTPEGLGNVVARAYEAPPVNPGLRLRVPYRNSMVGPGEFSIGRDFMHRWVENEASGGWLVDFTRLKPDAFDQFLYGTGTYRRLRFDTSVTTHSPVDLECSPLPSGGSRCRNPITFFMDPNDEFREWQKSN